MTSMLPPAERNGLFAIPADLAPLRRAARDAGLGWHVVDLQRARGKRALFTAFAREFAFPSTFGGNWDALADCLQDLTWRTEPGWIVVIRGAATFASVSPDDHAILCEILEASALFWRGRKKLFTVLTDDSAGRPAWVK